LVGVYLAASECEHVREVQVEETVEYHHLNLSLLQNQPHQPAPQKIQRNLPQGPTAQVMGAQNLQERSQVARHGSTQACARHTPTAERGTDQHVAQQDGARARG
jgi:hypothetical protein